MKQGRAYRRIDFAIIGVQKSATTALQYYLNDHPSVTLPLGEFACFESPDFEQGRTNRQLRDLAPTPGRILGIKRPTIFSDLIAINRVKDYSPECRLIMVCREPVGRFISAYFHLMNSGKIPVGEINKAVKAIFFRDYLSQHAAGTSLLRNGLYHDSLMHIRAVYGSECLFVTSQQDIRHDYERVTREVCDFLKIPFRHTASERSREQNVGSYDYRRARFLRLSNFLTYSYSVGRLRKEYRASRAAHWAGRALSATFRKWPFTNPIPRADVLSPESLEMLQSYYRLDKEKLVRDFPGIVYW